MPTTLVTGATGLVGSHVARALVERGDDVRVTVRPTSNSTRWTTSTGSTRAGHGRLLDRRAVRRALRGVERVFHVAGSTTLRASARRAVRGQRRRHAGRARGGAAGRASSGSCTPRRSRRSAPRRAARRPTRRSPSARRRYGLPYVDAKHEAEVEALRIAARGPAGRDRQPGPRVRAGDLLPLLDRARAALPAPPDPRLRRRRAEHRRRRGRGRAGTCSPTSAARSASATSSATATSRWTACSPTSAGCRASSRRR